jgi:hypothetical protein
MASQSAEQDEAPSRKTREGVGFAVEVVRDGAVVTVCRFNRGDLESPHLQEGG